MTIHSQTENHVYVRFVFISLYNQIDITIYTYMYNMLMLVSITEKKWNKNGDIHEPRKNFLIQFIFEKFNTIFYSLSK